MTLRDVLARSSSLRPHADVEPQTNAGAAAPRTHSRRLGLWQIDGGAQCSIIGTCLSDRELRDAVRKCLPLDARASNYEIHCHCSHASQADGPLARALTKLLNRRYAGAVSLAAKAQTEAEVVELWFRLRDSGQIAAGYWAVMSHRDVADCIKQRIFGEVHMLSHLHGRSIHELTTKLAETRRRCDELEARAARTERGRQEALIERDTALAERDAARTMLAERPALAPGPSTQEAFQLRADRSLTRLRRELARRERALVIARTRARSAEARLEQAEKTRKQRSQTSARRPECSDAENPGGYEAASPCLAGARILYIGGRNPVVPHLRSVAAARGAELSHHDGGVENSMHRVSDMIERCDVVICPVDCVSHAACRLAKACCLRMSKMFIPVPTASRASFERALSRLPSLSKGTVAAST
jgi:hypothetical protein